MNKEKLIPPCSYQGGKQRLSKQIVDIILEQNKIDENTKFYDLCCGSGSITLELVNQGINPKNIIMVDIGLWGFFWESIANSNFNLKIFKNEIDKLPSIDKIQEYLKEINKKPIEKDLVVYHFLLQQAGSFGAKEINIKGDKWINSTFRNYWMPTEKSNRKSPVNPMMPMPDSLYLRVESIVNNLLGNINAIQGDVLMTDWDFNRNSIIYIDPPYKNTSFYKNNFDYEIFIERYRCCSTIYISEGYEMESATSSILLSEGRKKGNMTGNIKKNPTKEWLNIYK